MRRCLVLLFAALSLAAVTAAPPPDKGGKDSSEPPELPGPFHPYNVNGPHKGKFHDLVSDYGLKPTVLIVHRGLEANDGLKDLLRQLDGAVEKNPSVHLCAFAVFVSDDLPEVVGATNETDDLRDKEAAAVEDLAKGLMLKHVVLCLDSKGDLEKYDLDKNPGVRILLYRKLQVLADYSMPRGQLGPDKVKEIMAAVTDKLGARLKKPRRGSTPPSGDRRS